MKGKKVKKGPTKEEKEKMAELVKEYKKKCRDAFDAIEEEKRNSFHSNRR